MMTLTVTIVRRTPIGETIREIDVTAARVGDAADAAALELGFTSWEQYSDWCEQPPALLNVHVWSW